MKPTSVSVVLINDFHYFTQNGTALIRGVKNVPLLLPATPEYCITWLLRHSGGKCGFVNPQAEKKNEHQESTLNTRLLCKSKSPTSFSTYILKETGFCCSGLEETPESFSFRTRLWGVNPNGVRCLISEEGNVFRHSPLFSFSYWVV